MAIWTMKRSGNTSVLSGTASSPWYDGSTQTALNSKPGNGDSIVKAGFNLVIDENTTIGTNTAAANAISGLGNLTISAGVTLVVRGLIPANNYVTFTMGNNSILEFDASATTPTSTVYGMTIGYAANFACGTGCVIRSNAGGGVGYLDFITSRKIDLTGLTLLRMGGLNKFAIKLTSLTTDPGATDSRLVITDCTFDTCGMRWITAGMPATQRCEIQRNRDVNNVGTAGSVYGYGFTYPFSWINVCGAASGGGTRLFENNACQHVAYFNPPSAWTSVKGNAFAGQIFTPDSVAGFPDFRTNLDVYNATVTGTGVRVIGNQTDCYHVADSTITDNWHALPMTITGDIFLDGLIFDAVGIVNSADPGEMIGLVNPAVACVATIRRCLGLPSMSTQNGDTSYKAACGALVWASGSNITVSVEHCTNYSLFAKGADCAIFATGETVATRTGQATSVQGNIAWSTKAGSAHLGRDRGFGGYTNNDVVTAAGHNGIYNGAASYSGTGGVGYYFLTSATTAGTGDLTTDPGFVDPTRNIATWAVTLGYSGTNSQLLTAAVAYISADCSLIETRLAALMAYVRAGFRPTNVAYRSASYTTDSATTDAGGNAYAGTYPDIGAMAYLAASAGSAAPIVIGDDPGISIYSSGSFFYI